MNDRLGDLGTLKVEQHLSFQCEKKISKKTRPNGRSLARKGLQTLNPTQIIIIRQ